MPSGKGSGGGESSSEVVEVVRQSKRREGQMIQIYSVLTERHQLLQLDYYIQMLWKQFSRKSISPCNKENLQTQVLISSSIKEIMTRRRDDRPKISNRYDQLDNLLDNYQLPRDIIARIIKPTDPLFDDALWKSRQPDLALKLFKDSALDRTAAFKERFMVGRQIGSGSYASVRICAERDTLKPFALKIYNKQNMSSSRKKSVLREVRILQMVRHPNVIRIHDAIETNNHVNLLLELAEGRAAGGLTPTALMRSVAWQVASALHYLHTRQITHRDIKLENILVCGDGDVKLIDFGFATLYPNSCKKKIYCGTPSYMAPEIVRKQNYRGPPVDIWALGVVIYNLATGRFPFKGSNDRDLFYLIVQGRVDFDLIGDVILEDLIFKMLLLDPSERVTAGEVLNHPWFHESVPQPLKVGGSRSTANSPRSTHPYQQVQSTVKKREKVSVEFENVYQMGQIVQVAENFENERRAVLHSYMSSTGSNKSPIVRRRQSANQTFDQQASIINQKA